MGPKIEVIGELRKPVTKVGLNFGLSFYRAEHAWFFNTCMKTHSDEPVTKNLRRTSDLNE